MLYLAPLSNTIWNMASLRIQLSRIRQVMMILVFLVSLVGVNSVPARADSAGLVCESFDFLTPGSMIGSYTGWTDDLSGPVVTSGIGVAGSGGLTSDNSIFNWTAHPFNWNATDFEKIKLQGDFQTDSNGQFDDDRLSWTIDGTSTSSNNQFGVQLDPTGIVTYWSNVLGDSKIYDTIVPLSGLPADTWYRFTSEVTKLTATSARIDVTLVMLDSSGNPTGTPMTGSIADTSLLASGHTPATGYFTPTSMVPSFKNFNTISGAMDNTCSELFTVTPGPMITVTGTPLSNFNSEPGTPSAEQSYTVSGSNLTEDISITAPTDFEISTTSGSAFGSSLVLPHSEGEVAATTIFVRLNRATEGPSSGDIIHTSSGAINKTVAVSGTASVPGNFAIQFDGTNDHVTFGSASGLNSSTYTLEAWFYWTGGGATTSTGNGGITAIPLITKGRGESESTGLNVNYFMGISGEKLAADFEAYSGGQNYPVTGTTTITTNTWHHAAATYNGTCWQLYLDGVAQTSGTTCPGVAPDYTSTQHAGIATAMTSTGVVSGYFQGVVDEVRIWNVARSGVDIANDRFSETPSSTSGLIAHWSMNESTGTTINDSAGANETGTLVNGPVWVPGFPPPDSTPPAAPTGLTAIPGNALIILDWGDNSDGDLAGYNIYRSLSSPVALANPINGSTLITNSSYTDPGLANGTSYYYAVTAVDTSANQSAGSNEVIATPLTSYGSALKFDGSNDYVTFGPNLNASSFTLEAWVKRDAGGVTMTTGSYGLDGTSGRPLAYPVLTKGMGEGETPANINMNWFLGITSTGVVGADFEDNAGGVNHPAWGSTVVPIGEWHHIAATYNGSCWALYLNGNLETLNASVTACPGATPEFNSLQHAGLAIGLGSTGQIAAGRFAGTIDEARVWNVARTGTEISASINHEILSATGLIGRWGMNEGFGSVINNSTGTTITGTLTNGPTWVIGYPLSPENYAPDAPVLVHPPDGTTGISTSPTLEVQVTDQDGDPMDVTFYGRASGSLVEDFALIVLPDTQFYSESYPDTYIAQTEWIVENKDALNIVYVAHEGDVVNVAGNTTQWNNADAAMSILEDPATTGLLNGIAYGIAIGNHDEGANYNTYFGKSRFAGRSYFGGEYPTDDMQNNYMLFSAGGMDFIVINLDYVSPAAGSLAWADGLLKSYSSHRAIVVSHDIVGVGNPATFSSWGSSVYNELKDNPNLFLMMNGHTFGEGQRSDTYNGNTIYSLLADYQSRSNGGNGWLRIMEFSPENDEIRVKTYSPTLNQWETDADSQFILSYNMDGGAPFENLGVLENVASGGNASLSWPGLLADAGYEWYVEVSDGSTTITGPVWSFTTIPPACYQLTLGHTGDGSNPTATPSQSDGCSPGSYHADQVIALGDAIPDLGWHFDSWYGTDAGSSDQLTMPASDHPAGANYARDEYTLTINTLGNGNVFKNPAQATYHYGDTVQLTAEADPGWTFSAWGDGLTGSANPDSITITGNTTVTATFTQDEYTLSVTPVGNGSVTKNPDKPTYHYGETVELTPVADTGWTFTGWGNDLSGTDIPATIVMNGNRNVTATFTQDVYTLTVTVLGEGDVTSDPPGGSYLSGTEVDLTALADPGWTFGSWGGDASGSASTTTILMEGNKTVIATFIESQYSLTIATDGNGTVTADVAPPYTHNQVVHLTADAAPGWTFAGWSGDLTGSDNPASLVIDGNKSITATFTRDEYTLTLTSDHGTVSKNPDKTIYYYGDTVDLQASADAGWTFAGWSGAVTSTDNPATVTVYGDTSVTANYTQNEYPLTVNTSGNGTVTLDPDQAVYQHGDTVQITAEAAPDWTFSGWTGDLVSSENPVSILMDGNKTVTATFTRNVHTHSIALQAGWNLVSFNLHPVNTNVADVLASVAGNYDLVYAWDETGASSGMGNWMKYDNIPLSPDNLITLDETMGFWIHMLAADTLDVMGYQPTNTEIALTDDVAGWNLVAYPSSVNGMLPGVLSDHGIGNSFSIVYAYHANDGADPWKLYDPAAPSYANDLPELAPGWGYWIKVNADNLWSVDYAAP